MNNKSDFKKGDLVKFIATRPYSNKRYRGPGIIIEVAVGSKEWQTPEHHWRLGVYFMESKVHSYFFYDELKKLSK